MELTAQKGKGDREKRTSDRARTRDLRSIAEFQPREPRGPVEIPRPPSPPIAPMYRSQVCRYPATLKIYIYLLLEMLVESVVMYGAEVWGCCRQLGEVEQVQLRAMRIFLGVGRLHPKVSLLVEMGVLPLEWVAKLKCVEFWYRVRKLGDERLVKHVAVEAWKQREMKWMKDLRQSIREMGWGEVKLEDVEKLSNFQLKEMLKSCAWREVRASWKQEMSEKPKLEVLRMIVDKDCKGRSAQIESKEVRRMVTKLRGGTAQLRIETGRWKGEGREERKCKECSGQEVEDAKHFLLKCERWQDEREELIERVKGTQRGGEFEAADDDEKLAMILDGACKERGVGMAIRKMWKKRFV